MDTLCTSLHLRTELPELLLLPPDIALQQLFILPTPSLLAAVWDRKISQPLNILKRRGKKNIAEYNWPNPEGREDKLPISLQVVLETATNRLPVL